MPILANAKKALRRSIRANVVNSRVRSKMRTAIKKVEANPTPENMNEVKSCLDIAVKRHIMHKNTAARVKSRLSKLKVGAKTTSTKVATGKTVKAKPTAKKTSAK